MASTTHTAGLDHAITVKVMFEGVTRRTKMPLRDMVPRTLESNIRTFLHIPGDVEVAFERYSDSAASYVLLEPENIPIYKQLYRAAKAKSKLKIRVTIKEQPKATVPKPVTVEDEPETSVPASAPVRMDEAPKTTHETSEEPSHAPTPDAEASAPTPVSNVASSETTLPVRINPLSRTYNSALLSDAARLIGERQDARRDFESRLANLMERQSVLKPITRSCPMNKPQQSPFSLPKPIPVSLNSCPAMFSPSGPGFAVCCNSCEINIPDIHYHCSTCDDGDFDLCQSCVDQGITCHGRDHWLIKRSTIDGQLVQSTTETIAPKPKAKAEVKVGTTIETKAEPKVAPQVQLPKPLFEPLAAPWASFGIMRTCNCCVQEHPEAEFLHCTVCEDFDLCQPCFAKDKHGHHPKHGFAPAVKGTKMPHHIAAKMSPGRNHMHHAICDGCDKYITGIRHKCLDCPDWDYCATCIKSVKIIHPGHRFAPIYEPLTDVRARAPAAVHVGICCDGPLCSGSQAYPNYIRGTRYKCAICNDLDFCANCEASPINAHNKTHPMIQFKTPVRHISVTTTGENQDGQYMPEMGDYQSTSTATETVPTAPSNSINPVRTIVDVKPTQEPVAAKVAVKTPEPEVKKEIKKESPVPEPTSVPKPELKGVFVRETIPDGTILPPNHVFEQTWTLRNDGKENWPAGCSVRFVSGDYMGHVDSNHPAGISELVSASESTVCYAPLSPGQEFPFTVLLRTPIRPGKVISYWRLTTPDGEKFGHRLWCDVNVRIVKEESKREPEPEVKQEPAPAPMEERKQEDDSQASSQMIFPKLEKESPVASIHEAVEPIPTAEEPKESDNLDDEWDYSEDGFMTDEEYDILDASDEEYLEEQKKKLATK
ncbi:ZZ type zinc finger domain protein [Fusarium beomiforme]|uniref:ZZ type zinc finger domain protein n=1 Tax=Fusarium beomiforme TaxID=44412 RepID=A0A9P5AJE4_9HYPO|nr:ZZ type zinc finger domain protein [Fusarium beomiforme]